LSLAEASLAELTIVGRAVGFAETRSVRELMAQAGQVDAFATDDVREGIGAFVEKRKAKFVGR
jgi:enoyl-CoA hydratase/carnithine racemase